MQIHSTNNTKKKNLLKFIALLSGYILWRVISNYHITSMTFMVPLSFYNIATYKITAPETVSVTLKGHKKSFIQLAETLAIHINIAMLHEGDNEIRVSNQNLFLPNEIKLVKWSPHYFTITLTKN
jgi:hypothetical protein